MDNTDQKKDSGLVIDKDSKISVVLNRADDDSDYIDLVAVLKNMLHKTRTYIWVLLFFVAFGVSAALLFYQVTKKPQKVSAVVTLDYDIAKYNAKGVIVSYTPVADLTAPDGTELDLNQITSSYVLQTALDGLELSQEVSLADLRRNIQISRILSEDSRRQQEVASNMIQDKNNQAYTQVQGIKLTYINQFIVTLTNGFGSEDSRTKYELKDSELSLVLDRILDAYNSYMVTTYADLKLPEDEISLIDADNQDILESIDLLRNASTNLHDFCDEKPEFVKVYRSKETGYTLEDLVGFLSLIDRVNVDYLSSYVYTNGVVTDRETMLTNYEYRLRDAETKLAVVNNNIQTAKDILDTYENDEIFVTMQESDTSKSTKTTTDYYNQLITQQADNYAAAAELETTIADLQEKIALLNSNDSIENAEAAREELDRAIETMYTVYRQIYKHFQEVMQSPMYTTYAEHSVAQTENKGFLSSAAKKIILGGAGGFVIACGLWFMSALLQEMPVKKKDGKDEEVKKA